MCICREGEQAESAATQDGPLQLDLSPQPPPTELWRYDARHFAHGEVEQMQPVIDTVASAPSFPAGRHASGGGIKRVADRARSSRGSGARQQFRAMHKAAHNDARYYASESESASEPEHAPKVERS